MALVALDNDECIGSWGDMSLLYVVYTRTHGVEPPPALFADIMARTGCIRPGLRETYDALLALKRNGAVRGVYMCTAARDDLGWVSFLRAALEAWYGAAVYDGVIHGGMIAAWHAQAGSVHVDAAGSVNKDMDLVRQLAAAPPDAVVLAIDDRPGNIANGVAIAVSRYTVAVNLMAVGRLCIPTWDAFVGDIYDEVLQKNWDLYLRSPGAFCAEGTADLGAATQALLLHLLGAQ